MLEVGDLIKITDPRKGFWCGKTSTSHYIKNDAPFCLVVSTHFRLSNQVACYKIRAPWLNNALATTGTENPNSWCKVIARAKNNKK